eukprot:m.299312 g.299312  ORF g.299312 m.299312 type:complete len:320 (+) comp14100_c0_seq1:1567-2526(+)
MSGFGDLPRCVQIMVAGAAGLAAGAAGVLLVQRAFRSSSSSSSSRAAPLAKRTTELNVSTTANTGGHAVYESRRAVHEYVHFHFGPDEDFTILGQPPPGALGFVRRCAELCREYASPKAARALDVGCAVGGSTFELARHFRSAIGIDFSNAFIDAAKELKYAGQCEYKLLIEGTIKETRIAKVPADIERSRCSFQWGDACSMSRELGMFDVILAANLLCRLPDPAAFLEDATAMLNKGGILVLVSPFSWVPDYTPPQNWIGGSTGTDDKPVRSADRLRELLEATGKLELVHQSEMPFIIRNHIRRYQWGISCAMVWRRL